MRPMYFVDYRTISAFATGSMYLCWLAFMSGIYIYNCMSCTLRAGFRAGPFYVFPYELEAHRQKYLDLARENATDCVLTTYSQNGTAVLTSCLFNETAAEELIPPFPVSYVMKISLLTIIWLKLW